jgi:predicted DNA-binding transcriptional regulator AlpA
MTERLLRMSEITKLTGVHREAINRRVLRGTFPAPKKMGHAIAWLESEVIAWHANLPTATYGKKEGGPT